MQRHLIDAGNPLFNELEAIVIGKAGRIFFDHKQMQPVALAGRLFYQPAVAEGEWIGIHHDSADFSSRLTVHRQLSTVTSQPFAAIFH